MATSLQRPLYFVSVDSPYIYFFIYLSTMENNTHERYGIDPYGTFMINHSNCILILFRLQSNLY